VTASDPTRRGLLALVGSAALAGCGADLGGTETPERNETLSPAPLPETGTPTADDRPTLSASLPGQEMPARPATAQGITMGCDNEEKVYFFSPSLAWVEPGTTVRWGLASQCRQRSSAYHPDNGLPLRIPEDATPWESPVMQGTGTFSHQFDTPGVYDWTGLFEAAGQVGVVVVGRPSLADQPALSTPGDAVPEPARENLHLLHDHVRAAFE
jgi:plastocyanin